MNGPTLITQPPGYPEERPESDDMDSMLDHLAAELEGKQLLEKPRVSKKASGYLSTYSKFLELQSMDNMNCFNHRC